jgi:hypothetical protein
MEQSKRNHPKALFSHPSDTCRFITIAGIGGTLMRKTFILFALITSAALFASAAPSSSASMQN